MRKMIVAVLVASAMVVAAAAAWADIAPTLVKGGPGDQITGMGNTDWVVWSSNSTDARSSYNAYAKETGFSRFKLNAARTKGFFGSLNGDTGETIFQQTSGGRQGSSANKSSIYLYDLDTRTRTSPGAGVNTKRWEWSPSVSDGHILFGRNDLRRKGSLWKVMLYDRVAHTFKTLDSGRNACRCIFPGQVTDQYATWTRCSRTLCQSWYYTIGTGDTAMIPNPLDRQTYYPAVADGSGNLYFARSNTGCGAGTKILRWNPSVGGSPVVVSALPNGRDLSTTSLAFHDTGDNDDVFLSMLKCSGRFYANIYKIEDADTATTFAREGAGAGSAPRAAKHLLPPGAVPAG